MHLLILNEFEIELYDQNVIYLAFFRHMPCTWHLMWCACLGNRIL